MKIPGIPVAFVTVILVGTSLLPLSGAQAAPANSGSTSVEVGTAALDMTRALTLLESIPDPVLAAGDDATRAWVSTRSDDFADRQRGSILACAGAIAALIATTAIPAAKILKIKKLITAGGGVAKVVRLYWGASFNYEKIRAIGGAAGALALEIVGVTAIKKACF